MNTYISDITGNVWTEEEIVNWTEDFYIAFESNIPNFTRPSDAVDRVKKVLQLRELEDNNVYKI